MAIGLVGILVQHTR